LKSIKLKIALISIIISSLAYFLILAITYSTVTHSIVSQNEQFTRKILSLKSQQLGNYLDGIISHYCGYIKNSWLIKDSLVLSYWDMIKSELATKILEKEEDFYDIILVSESGKAFSSLNGETENFSDEGLKVFKTYPQDTLIRVEANGSDTLLNAYFRVYDENSKIIGFSILKVKTDFIKSSIGDINITGVVNSSLITDDGSFFSKDEGVTQDRIFVSADITSQKSWKIGAYIDKKTLNAELDRIIRLLSITVVIITIISTFLYILTGTILLNPLKELEKGLEIIKQGNLKKDLRVKTKDEIYRISCKINEVTENLRDVMAAILGTSNELGSSSEDFKIISHTLKSSSDRLHTDMTQIHSKTDLFKLALLDFEKYMQHLESDMNENYSHSEKIEVFADDIKKDSSYGLSKINHCLDFSEKTIQRIELSDRYVGVLAKHSESIEAIVHAIEKITSQTNMLAVNASIQAAKAGESGKGFGVVASEIRKLASESKTATEKIYIVLKQIKDDGDKAKNLSAECLEDIRTNNSNILGVSSEFSSIGRKIVELSVMLDKMKKITQSNFSETSNILINLKNLSKDIVSIQKEITAIAETCSDQKLVSEKIKDYSDGMSILSKKLSLMLNKFKT